MPLYTYKCSNCGEFDIRHPIEAVDDKHYCPTCGKVARRKFYPLHHRWPSQYYPGNEHSGQRMLLDPEFQARQRDKFAREKEERRA
jgi:putative FmdB family regulatory protein